HSIITIRRLSHSTNLPPYLTLSFFFFFFFNDPAPTEIYTLSLHDALPICAGPRCLRARRDRRADQRNAARRGLELAARDGRHAPDRKSTRLNSSHVKISYAVFCLKKKKKNMKKRKKHIIYIIVRILYSMYM